MRSSDKPFVLQSILADIAARNTEIQNRSSVQNSLTTGHIATLTVLFGTLSNPSIGRWFILVIPLESFMLGLWWIDNAKAIHHIGTYLRKEVEPKIETLIHENVLQWEKYNMKYWKNDKNTVSLFNNDSIFSIVQNLTYPFPAGISLLLSLILIILSILMDHKVYFYFKLDQIKPYLYTGYEYWIAILFWLFDSILFIFYIEVNKERTYLITNQIVKKILIELFKRQKKIKSKKK